MYVCMYIHTYKESKLKAADISHIILYCVVFIHTQVCPVWQFLLLQFADIIVCLTDWRFVAVFFYADLSPPFQQYLFTVRLLSHFRNFCNILNFLIIIIIFVLVTPEQIVIFGHHKLCPYKMADSVNKFVFWLPCQAAILHLSLSLGLLVPWDKTTLEWGQLITLQWPLSMQVKGRVSRLTLNQRLNDSKESISEAELGQNWGLLCASYSRCEHTGKVLEGDWKCYSSKHKNEKKVKRPYHWYRESFSGLDRR